MYWDERGKQIINVRELLPPHFARVNFRAIELLRTLRFTINNRPDASDARPGLDTRFFELALTKDENGVALRPPQTGPHQDSPVPSSGPRFVPTITAQCDLYGYLDNPKEAPQSLYIGHLGSTEPSKLNLGTSAVQDDTSGNSFIRSVSFSSDCRSVAVRQSIDFVHIIPIEIGNGLVRLVEERSLKVRIPEAVQDVIQPSFGRLRPLMALSAAGDEYRLAWLTRDGVAVVNVGSRLEGEQRGGLLFDRPLLTGLENGAKLQFSRDGKFLILNHQSWSANAKAKLRVWEITGTLDRIPQAGHELVAEACRVARQENGKAELEKGESMQWFGESRPSPCRTFIETLSDQLFADRGG
jgi:hypothetical protein